MTFLGLFLCLERKAGLDSALQISISGVKGGGLQKEVPNASERYQNQQEVQCNRQGAMDTCC